jgi:hypothetical protein
MNTKQIPYIVIIGLLLYIFFSHSNKPKTKEVIRYDTIIKTVTIPEINGTFTNPKPKPIYIKEPADDKELQFLHGKINELLTDVEKKDFLLSQLSTKVYNKTYSDKDVEITVIDTISGKILHQDVIWTIKPKEIEVKEVTITKELKPRFSLSVGGGVIVNPINQQFYGFLGMKNAKGYELQLGMTTDKGYMIGVKKDLFTKF